MRWMRFRLLSMLASTLTAAVFLGANLVLQFGEESRLTLCPSDIRMENNFAYVEVYTKGEEWVWISQGWPFCVQEQDALTRQIPRGATPAKWAFSTSTPRYYSNRSNLPANVLIGIFASLAVMVGVEWVLRRRERA